MAELLRSVMADMRWAPRGKWPLAIWAAIALSALCATVYLAVRTESAAPPSLSSTQLASQELCLEGALLYHDVRWAYVCTTLAERGQGDGHPECELPEAEATRLSSWLQQADQKCMSEAVTLR
jgi:hypothetical protein